MTLFEAFALGLLQGLTEFLPVSSSGHLILAEYFFGLSEKNLLSFDVILHAGTLLALFLYFRKELLSMIRTLLIDLKLIRRGESINNQPKSLVYFLIVATIPAVIIGPFLKDVLETYFRSPNIVVLLLLVTALLLAVAEMFGRKNISVITSYLAALVMGIFQVLAILPGISRSGSTIVGGLFMGLTREAAARFSFLMAIPAIFGATVFVLKDYQDLFLENISWSVLFVGFLASFLMSWLCVSGFIKFLRTRSLWWFVVYLFLVNIVFWLTKI